MDSRRLLSMAGEGRWKELLDQIAMPANLSAVAEALPQLEAMADHAVESRIWSEAGTLYQAAIAGATFVIQSRPYDAEDSLSVQSTLYRLCEKLRSAMEQAAASSVEREPSPAPSEPEEPVVENPPAPTSLEELIPQITTLAQEGRRDEWQRLIKHHENKRHWPAIAEQLEAAGDRSRDRQFWFQAQELYAAASAAAPGREVALRLIEKGRRMMLAIVDAKLEHPGDSSDAESLALAGRFAEADDWLQRFPDQSYDSLTRCEAIGDHLLNTHPEIARWFYDRFLDAACTLPADTAYEGSQRDGIVQTARQKIGEANARVPRRVATVELVLTGLGLGPRPTPETYIKTVENDQILKLVPERELFTDHCGADGKLEPLPADRLLRYYFRVWIEGEKLLLTQEHDEYGRREPFAFEGRLVGFDLDAHRPFRLEIGKPVVIAFNVPGGGPQWTLTLREIQAV
jgi:hypothetical protein